MNDTATVLHLALLATGPIGERSEREYLAEVNQWAMNMAVMTSERSPLTRKIETLAKCKVFTAVIERVRKEKSSTRVLVDLKTAPSKFHPDGKERARTERTDTPDGLAMGLRLKGLLGRRVLLWVDVQDIRDGTEKSRVIAHVEDLGPDYTS